MQVIRTSVSLFVQLGFARAKVVGSKCKSVVSLSGVMERCVHQGTPLRGHLCRHLLPMGSCKSLL